MNDDFVNHRIESERIILSVIKDHQNLRNRVRIIVPSTFDVDKKLSPKELRRFRQECVNKMNSIFGGSTAFHGSGSYFYQEEDENNLAIGEPRHISECILYIESFVNIDDEKKLQELIAYARKLCSEMSQDSILVGFDDYNIFVKPAE
jgi:hypothetical protein